MARVFLGQLGPCTEGIGCLPCAVTVPGPGDTAANRTLSPCSTEGTRDFRMETLFTFEETRLAVGWQVRNGRTAPGGETGR